MSHPSRRPLAQPSRPGRARWSRLTVAAVLSVLPTAACGMNVQTTNPYTPAIGVNFDAGDVQIRDLAIVSRAKGSGFLSGTLSEPAAAGLGTDSLVSVSGTATKSDGTDGAPLSVTLPGPIKVTPTKPVVLTNGPLINVTSADLQMGLTAKIVLRFGKAGEATTNAPVLDGTLPQYATIGPSPSPSG